MSNHQPWYNEDIAIIKSLAGVQLCDRNPRVDPCGHTQRFSGGFIWTHPESAVNGLCNAKGSIYSKPSLIRINLEEVTRINVAKDGPKRQPILDIFLRGFRLSSCPSTQSESPFAPKSHVSYVLNSKRFHISIRISEGLLYSLSLTIRLLCKMRKRSQTAVLFWHYVIVFTKRMANVGSDTISALS
jgi:hypothetical protein